MRVLIVYGGVLAGWGCKYYLSFRAESFVVHQSHP